MRAVRVVAHGEPQDVVRVEEADEPTPGPGEALVRVGAGSLNFGDVARARGGVAMVTPAPPFTLGMDVAGVVEAVGDGLDASWVGRRVVGMAQQSVGGLAELAVCGTVFDAPVGLDDVTATAMTLPFHVSYLALHERARLQPGETVLVRGAASAVGTAAVQLVKAAGARVVAVAGSPDKAALCERLGADVVLDKGADLFEAVMDATEDRGADVVFDPVGGEATETMWTCAALGGRYLAVGFNDDAMSGLTGRPLRKVSMANLTVMGVLLAYFDTPRAFRQFGINAFPPEVGERVHAALLELVATGAVTPYVGRVVEMDEVGAALADHAAGRTMGRTVVRIGGAA
jgi:NADPH:quinone reductase